MTEILLRRCAIRTDTGDARRNPSCRREQEVTRAAGRVDDRKFQQRLGGIVRLGLGLVEDGVEGCVEQRLNEAVGRVVRAGGLTLVALLLGGLGGEDQRLAVIAQLWLQFEEGFVDGPQFFSLHRAPVDWDDSGFLVEPGEPVERLHEGAVTQAGGFEVGQLVSGEKPAECGEGEGVLTVGQRVEDDLDALIAVVVFVPRGGAVALRAQDGEAVAFGIKLTGVGLGLFGVQQVAILGHHQEDQAIDEAQEFVEPFGQVYLARFQLVAQVGVGLEEAGAEHLERELDLDGQPVAGNFALLRPSVAPALQRAIGGRGALNAKAGAVNQEPEDGEGRGILIGEDLGEVGLDIGWASQRCVVAHQTDQGAVGDKAPEGFVMLVQVILKREGGRACAVRREGRATPVELFV